MGDPSREPATLELRMRIINSRRRSPSGGTEFLTRRSRNDVAFVFVALLSRRLGRFRGQMHAIRLRTLTLEFVSPSSRLFASLGSLQLLPRCSCGVPADSANQTIEPPRRRAIPHGTLLATKVGMLTDRIDFISEYCDRWCERCAFTTRCSAYAVQAALGMCGDLTEALQLAVGRPMEAGATSRPVTRIQVGQPTPQEVRELEAEVELHAKRIREAPLTQHAMEVAVAEHRWFETHAAVRESADAVVREAISVVSWNSTFIGGKVARAQHGRESGDNWDDDPIQNDWNGSAKIALMSIERSESAWLTIARATGNAGAAELASAMSALRGDVEEAFPFARLFKRPGFDEW